MPVAEEPVYTNPEDVKRMIAEFPDHFPHPQKIPTEKEKIDFLKLIEFNGLWYMLTYGASLLSKVVPWLGTGFKLLVKWHFKGNWEQKEVGF
jgi:hypothetical protein